MAISYPRECSSCKRVYSSRSTYSGHQRNCAKYAAVYIVARKREEEAVEKLLVSDPITSHDSVIPEPLVIPVPDAVTRSRFITDKATFYVVQTAHSFNCGLNVYKVGRTIDMPSRMRGYPKGSLVILQLLCKDAESFEHHILALLLDAD